MKVVVFGATGTVGEALLPALAGDHEVTAVSRSAEERQRDGVRWVRGDVEDGESVDRALEGAEVVYYLVHSLGTTAFEERERRGADNVARAADKAGLRQIVYLGGLGDDSDDLSPHLRSRRETERRLASGSVPVTTLRAGMVVAKGSAAFETIAALVDRLPVMILPRWAKTPTQPIALVDVVRYLAGVCGNAAALGQTFDVAGPDVMSYAEMISRISRLKGKAPYLVEVPVLTPWLSALWIELITPARADIARPLVEGLRNPTVAKEERIRKLVPFELTRFDDAARTALD
ncbi:MAG TPA: NAD(P)H-binding protein [Gaiellaceae bacterium]|nr:NAD(P)H-binding protein [Gaiellaceae bacterium]